MRIALGSLLALSLVAGGCQTSRSQYPQDAKALFGSYRAIDAEGLFKVVAAEPEHFYIVDLRPYYIYAETHIPGAVSIPFHLLNERQSNIPKFEELVLYCDDRSCMLDDEAAKVLLQAGYRHINILDDGIKGWLDKGYPTSSGDKP
ncbi:MAG: rhodanese-like domain-containing protein [Elusimicrobiota bacterium]